MRKETICITEAKLMFVVGGQLFDQAPNRQPRKAEIIMQKVRDSFREKAFNDNECYAVAVEKESLYKWIEQLLFAIPEFRDLNLSHIEHENAVSVDDENRAKFALHTRYDKYDSESWKRDFVDLDAFIQNVNRMLRIIIDSDYDCFMCVHQGSNAKSTLDCGTDEECKNCSVNRNLKNNYIHSRSPRGKYTFACKYDCPKNLYICCEECDDKESCTYRCDGKSDNCGNAIHKNE